MQVTETKAEGLKREFKVTVPAGDIAGQVTHRLEELVHTVRLPGFRPGKVPVGLLRKKYGPSVMGEVLEHTVNDSSRRAMSERGLRPALAPKIEVTSFAEGADLEYTMAVELLPEIGPIDFSSIKLERLVVGVDEAEVEATVARMAKAHRTTETVTEERPARAGDVLLIDFIGTVDGKEFAGGQAKSYLLELGSNSLLPGFEDQLVGAKAGQKVRVEVTFPATYGAAGLAGKAAVFDVDVREIRLATPAPIDDELAKKMGIENLETLRQRIRDEHERELRALTRARLKRELLDALAEGDHFEVPAGMAEREFNNIWEHFERQRKARESAKHGSHDQEGERDPDPDHDHDHDHDHGPGHDHDHGSEHDSAAADEFAGMSEDEIKEEFRTLAERRVRLGLLLSDIGHRNNIEVSQDDIKRAMAGEARRFPGREQKVIDYYRNTPEAMQALTAPVYEDKVVDFILEMAAVTERKATLEELTAAPAAEATAKRKAGGRKESGKEAKAATKKEPRKEAKKPAGKEAKKPIGAAAKGKKA